MTYLASHKPQKKNKPKKKVIFSVCFYFVFLTHSIMPGKRAKGAKSKPTTFATSNLPVKIDDTWVLFYKMGKKRCAWRRQGLIQRLEQDDKKQDWFRATIQTSTSTTQVVTFKHAQLHVVPTTKTALPNSRVKALVPFNQQNDWTRRDEQTGRRHSVR